MNRNQKRINVILFYLLLLAVLGGVIYFMTRPEMTCSDGIKNQGEEKIDCGGPCAPCQKKIQFKDLQIKSIERANNGEGGEDILIQMYNPNEEYGAKVFKYKIYDEDKNSNTANHEGKDFILPKETKYIVINLQKKAIGKIKIIIDKKSIDWKKIINFKDSNLVVYNKKYNLGTSDNVYSNLTGLLINKSTTDYRSIKIKGILRDFEGKLVAASYQVISTVPSGSKREFRIIFPKEISSNVATQEIEVETNVLDTENYLKVRGQQNKLDQ